MTKDQLEQWYAEWRRSKDRHDPVESSDDYYWAGASSLRDFLLEKLAS